MTRKQILTALRNVRMVEAWVRVSDDDGTHVRVSKAEVRRMFADLADRDYDGNPINYKARVQGSTLLLDC